jgi:hypothetical protein
MMTDIISHLQTLLEQLPESMGIPLQTDIDESIYRVEEVRNRLAWPQITTPTINSKARDKFITELEALLSITGGEELNILERGPGLVSVSHLLEEASEYFPGDAVLEAVVLEIYESVKAYEPDSTCTAPHKYPSIIRLNY